MKKIIIIGKEIFLSETMEKIGEIRLGYNTCRDMCIPFQLQTGQFSFIQFGKMFEGAFVPLDEHASASDTRCAGYYANVEESFVW